MMLSVLLLSVLLTPGSLERPHLTIAQGLVESNLDSRAVGTSGEKGGWQVIEKYWGKVPTGIVSQARQSERILNEIRENNLCGLFDALVAYNGTGRKAVKYARKVRKCAIELAMITMPEMSKIDVARRSYGTSETAYSL